MPFVGKIPKPLFLRDASSYINSGERVWVSWFSCLLLKYIYCYIFSEYTFNGILLFNRYFYDYFPEIVSSMYVRAPKMCWMKVHEYIFSERNSSFFVLWTLYIQDGQFVLLSSKTNRQFQIYSDRWDPAIFEGRLGNQTRIDKLLSLSTLFRPDTHFRRHMQTVQTLIRCR